jgi:hypothetical protein
MLDVRVQKTAAPAHILQRKFRTIRNFFGATRSRTVQSISISELTKRVPAKVISNKIRLEERTHLRVSRSRMIKNQEMNLETRHINTDRQHDQACYPSSPMPRLVTLQTGTSVMIPYLHFVRRYLPKSIADHRTLSKDLRSCMRQREP